MDNLLINNVDGLLKSAGLTGNTFIDSLIIASLVPLVIAYINSVFTFIKTIFGHIFRFLQVYVTNKIKTRFVGKILCVISISEGNQTFNLLKNSVFDKSIGSDIDSTVFKKICSITDDDELKKHYDRLTHYDKFDMNIDYTGKKIFLINKKFGNNNMETKIFIHNDNYIKIAIKNNDDVVETKKETNCITIELITFKTIEHDNEKYASEIENFLLKKFNISNKMLYQYCLKTEDGTLTQCITNFLSNGLLGNRYGLLKYGDIYNEQLTNSGGDEKIAQRECVFHSKYKNVLSIDDSNNDIILSSIDNGLDSNMENYSIYETFDVFKKYVGGVASRHAPFGHYFDSDKLILIQSGVTPTGKTSYQINIVSFGKILCVKDIKETIKFIINTGRSGGNNMGNIVKTKNNVPAYKYTGGWVNYALDRRSFDTIFIKDEVMQEIRKEMEAFFRIEKLYKECDVPYRKGILFYGPPGTGKTSLVRALAYEYQIPVYMVNINDNSINDDTIIDMLNCIGGNGNKILLFEDIDSAFSEKEKVKFENKNNIMDFKFEETHKSIKDRKYLTYAGLLNALDGILSNHHGVITIMTTNYIEKLGDALIRPGRIDHKYMLGPCDQNQIIKMTSHIVNKSLTLMKEKKIDNLSTNSEIYTTEYISENIQKFSDKLVDNHGLSKINPCKLQQYILKNIENIENVFKNYQELLN